MQYREEATSYAQAIMKLDGQEYAIKTKSYGDSVESTDIEGSSMMSIGRTQGAYKTDETSIEMYADDFAELIERFGEQFFLKTFTVTNTYMPASGSKLKQDELVRCRFTKRAASDSAGSDATTRTLSIKPVLIRWNGKNPLPAALMPKGI
ncbi:hypothetical protein [Deinococcus arenicola]|uniref:Uncharacterized protein n=1 Tax=Deinococcus arenicola TaxID=2994950 RepID=A0ABU4DXG1_9DEIO|nr:hypothetical protein [Deinococcus sp. ZS9-10]MDV6376369.1 hypothetical protein [Deinococcus sp. ZS9-10]